MKMKNPIFILVLIIAIAISVYMGAFSGNAAERRVCRDKDTGQTMTLGEAIDIAMNSGCFQDGPLKDIYMCNEDTGTWWIDLEVDSPGCNPACVIDIVTGDAETNWRCTGALPEELLE